MKSITIDYDNVTILDINNVVGRLESLVSRKDFSTKYNMDLSEIWSLAYEPDRKIYHVETANGVFSYSDVNKSPILLKIKDIEPTFLKDEQIKYLENNKPSKYHTVNIETLKYDLSVENKALYETNKLIDEIDSYIKKKVQDEIDKYNENNNLTLGDVNSLFKYTRNPEYTHFSFCNDLLDWNESLWEKARSIQEEVLTKKRDMPTKSEIIAELPIYVGV